MIKYFYGLLVVCITTATIYLFCPKPEAYTFTTYSKAFIDSQGELLRITLAEDDRYRIYQPLDQVSPLLISATILYEDQNYYSHKGIDYLALLRAFWTTYVAKDRRIGASTIPMQVARLRWRIPSNTIKGKITQILRAIQLSRHYAKQEILEQYLNLAPYGRNIEGIGAASLIYFGKSPAALSLPEALTLAVIPQNPNKRSPTTAAGYASLLSARQSLFDRWLQDHPEDHEKKKYFDLPLSVRSPEQLPFLAPHFVNYVNENLSRWTHGYINTTLDHLQQKTLEKVMANHISSMSEYGITNAAALLINYETMEIKSMVGSANFFDGKLQGQVNGVLAKRSPGSALKPFVYGLAIDEGLIHSMTLLKDSPRRFGGFTPENYDKRFLGPITAKDALIESRNVPAVDLQSQLKKKSFYRFLQQAGITHLKEEHFYGLALALGGGEITMLELATLYAMLPNQGILKPIKSIKTNFNNETSQQLLSAEATFLILDILKDNPAPNDLGLDIHATKKNQIAWKTGTSWAFRDAWAVGVSGPYILVVWIGNFDGTGNEAFIGRTAAGPLLFSIFAAIFPDQGWRIDHTISPDGLNLKKVRVCKNTGDLFSQYCPASTEAWFIPGVSPIKVSNIYRAIPIEKTTGRRACWFTPGKTKMEIFEFWPSDFLQIFRQAGISLKTPPRYAEECSMNQKSSAGQDPKITSPQDSIEYVIQSDKENNHQIPFAAIVDPDVKKIYWFVNEQFVGTSENERPLLWQASTGHFTVKAVDDYGRGTSTSMSVVQPR